MDEVPAFQSVVRLRPLAEEEEPCSSIRADEVNNRVTYRKGGSEVALTFSKVLSADATQDDVWKAVQPALQKVLAGYNVVIFAYGPSGSGKSHTLGTKSTSQDAPGLLQHIAEHLCHTILAENGVAEGFVELQALELYDEKLYDLLGRQQNCRDKLQLSRQSGEVEGHQSRVYRKLKSLKKLLMAIRRASEQRQTGATRANSTSSRSHALFTFRVQSNSLSPIGKVTVVDLAGSERLDGAPGETKSINQSLLSLSTVIKALVRKQHVIPYRDSLLTTLLRDCLGGGSYTVMVSMLSCASSATKESGRTLTFTSSAMSIVNVPVLNKTTDSSKSDEGNVSDEVRIEPKNEGKNLAAAQEGDEAQREAEALVAEDLAIIRSGKVYRLGRGVLRTGLGKMWKERYVTLTRNDLQVARGQDDEPTCTVPLKSISSISAYEHEGRDALAVEACDCDLVFDVSGTGKDSEDWICTIQTAVANAWRKGLDNDVQMELEQIDDEHAAQVKRELEALQAEATEARLRSKRLRELSVTSEKLYQQKKARLSSRV